MSEETPKPGPPGPGYHALRKGRNSAEGHSYALSTRAAAVDLRAVAQLLIAEARLLEAEGLVLLHLVVAMPDHCHLLLTLLGGNSLESVMRRWKGRCARQGNSALQRSGPFWQPGFYDRRMRDLEETAAHQAYILRNPVRRGLVTHWQDYPHIYLEGAALWQR